MDGGVVGVMTMIVEVLAVVESVVVVVIRISGAGDPELVSDHHVKDDVCGWSKDVRVL